jgi:hypothetical protein
MASASELISRWGKGQTLIYSMLFFIENLITSL